MYENYQEAHSKFLEQLFSNEYQTGSLFIEPSYSYFVIPCLITFILTISLFIIHFKGQFKQPFLEGIIGSIILTSVFITYLSFQIYEKDYDTLVINQNENGQTQLQFKKRYPLFGDVKTQTFLHKDVRQINIFKGFLNNCTIEVTTNNGKHFIELPMDNIKFINLKKCDIYSRLDRNNEKNNYQLNADSIEFKDNEKEPPNKFLEIKFMLENEPKDTNTSELNDDYEFPLNFIDEIDRELLENEETDLNPDENEQLEQEKNIEKELIDNENKINQKIMEKKNPHSSDNKGKIQKGSNDLILSIIYDNEYIENNQKTTNNSIKDEILDFLEKRNYIKTSNP